MSGILDSKTRVLDTIVTLEGRRQIASGKLRIAHISFTDSTAFYAADAVSGSADATARLYLESSDLPQDQIVFESDDSGRLVPFRSSVGTTQVRAGQLFTYDIATDATGSVEYMQLLSGSSAVSASEEFLDSSISNFQNQLLLGTRDQLFEDDGFGVGPSDVTFTITDSRPITRQDAHVANLDQLESLFQDQRLSRLPNFKYLPPINALPSGTDIDKTDTRQTAHKMLGNYKPWGKVAKLNYGVLRDELETIARAGGRRVITFDPSTRLNRVIGQMFEHTPAGLRKLDVIDFGVHRTGNAMMPTAHVFFVGKLYKDSVGTDTFVHLFTLVFE